MRHHSRESLRWSAGTSSPKYPYARGVATRPYLPAIHLQPPYRERFGYAEGMLPVTERVSRSTLALPFYVQLEDDDIAHVAASLREVLQEL